MADRGIAVLDAPSVLGLRPPAPGRVPGCWRLPEALRRHGLVERLHAADAGRVEPPPYRPEIDPATGVRNGDTLPGYSVALADRLQELLGTGAFPLLLGGDCSILLGAALALRRRGRYGLVSVDGGLDFRHPGNAHLVGPVGSVAGEDLAVVTGRGAEQLTNLEGRRPLVRDADVVAVGHRGLEGIADEVLATPMTLYDAAGLRRLGPEEVAGRAVATLAGRGVEGFWVHVDADVLDPEVMPAVDSPEPGGLTHQELAALLRGLTADGLATGVQLTIFDPELDADGHLAAELTATVVAGLAPRAAPA
ncbi:MAG TPA: arginase family protein [Actinomycetes bacterium]|jgi:arginase|nr:arginase family protein [Actinomycetes bacterium]